MREHPIDVIVDKFQEAVVHVLEHRSGGELILEAVDAADALRQLGYGQGNEAEMVSACTGLEGHGMRCALTVIARISTTKTLAPLATNELDWMGELANLLLGSMKNKLIAYGMNPVLGLPSTTAGLDLKFLTDVSDHVVVLAITTAGPVVVALNFELGPAEIWEFDRRLAPADQGVVCYF